MPALSAVASAPVARITIARDYGAFLIIDYAMHYTAHGLECAIDESHILYRNPLDLSPAICMRDL
jgi:hypothetical protein